VDELEGQLVLPEDNEHEDQTFLSGQIEGPTHTQTLGKLFNTTLTKGSDID
jgi:hypothetical protein